MGLSAVTSLPPSSMPMIHAGVQTIVSPDSVMRRAAWGSLLAACLAWAQLAWRLVLQGQPCRAVRPWPSGRPPDRGTQPRWPGQAAPRLPVPRAGFPATECLVVRPVVEPPVKTRSAVVASWGTRFCVWMKRSQRLPRLASQVPLARLLGWRLSLKSRKLIAGEAAAGSRTCWSGVGGNGLAAGTGRDCD